MLRIGPRGGDPRDQDNSHQAGTSSTNSPQAFHAPRVLDWAPIGVGSLEEADNRRFEIKVAGPRIRDVCQGCVSSRGRKTQSESSAQLWR